MKVLSQEQHCRPRRAVCIWGRVSGEFRECGGKSRDIPTPSPSLSSPHNRHSLLPTSSSHPEEDKTNHPSGPRLVPFTSGLHPGPSCLLVFLGTLSHTVSCPFTPCCLQSAFPDPDKDLYLPETPLVAQLIQGPGVPQQPQLPHLQDSLTKAPVSSRSHRNPQLLWMALSEHSPGMKLCEQNSECLRENSKKTTKVL